MRRTMRVVLLWLVLVLILPGCGDRIYIEDVTLGLMLGIDLDEQNQLVYYLSSPIFIKEAKKKNEEVGLYANTLRESRREFDSVTTGLTVRGKVQVLLIGERLLRHENWFQLLDAMFRDSKFTVNARVAVVRGSVDEVIRLAPKDKPRLPLHMAQLIDTANQRNITIRTTLQELHRQMFEKGITPSMSEVRKSDQIRIKGTALLNEKGKYMTSLHLQDTVLLKILQKLSLGDVTLTIHAPADDLEPQPAGQENEAMEHDELTMLADNVVTHIKSDYSDGKFRFDIKVNIEYNLSERMALMHVDRDGNQLSRQFDEQLQLKYERLIKTIQKNKIDPIGLGLYARAHQYKEWKRVEDKWGETLAKADIRVTVKSHLKNVGRLK